MINLKNTQRKITIKTERLVQDAQKILDILDYNDFDLGIWITTNATIKRYNRNFRHKDKPTDILSFPFYQDLKPNQRIKAVSEDEKNLGDLIISAEYVIKDAEQYDMSFDERMRVLLVHGICHLLGYDHITDEDYAVMHAQENKILKKLKS